jgi:peptidoglycan lytic transglycosylase
MYVPAPAAQPAAVASLAGIVSEDLLLAPAAERPLASQLDVRGANLNVLDGQPATVTGTLLPGLPGRLVALQALGRRGWATVASTRTANEGRFRLRYVAREPQSDPVRLRFAGDPLSAAARRRVGRLNVYRPAEASWYGGGGSLACGGELTSATLGVASKTLPCGTLVTLRYGGHSVRVPVIDRGPYVAGREYDLTEATKRALGFGDGGEVWSTR